MIRRTPGLRIAFICTPLIGVFLIACGTDTPVSPDNRSPFAYAIDVRDRHPDSLFIVLQVSEVNSPRRFILPYHYGDNPVDSVDGSLVQGLSVSDASGSYVGWYIDSAQVGPRTSAIVNIPSAIQLPFTIRYRANLSAILRAPPQMYVPQVRFDGSTGFLTGPYLFPLPDLGNNLAVLWRTPLPISLSIEVPKGMPYSGMPPVANYSMMYQLLFVQIVLGYQPISQDLAATPPFRIYNLSSNKFISQENVDHTKHALRVMFDEITPRFGSFGHSPYTFVFMDFGGGAMEGSHGFLCDILHFGPKGELGAIVAHELYHHFVGVHCGEYDDPWWKESVATYLGIAGSVRRGLMDKSYVQQTLVREFHPNADEQRYTLSSPALRNDLYPRNLGNLVYWRGAQVVMLMDHLARTGSDNRSSIDDIMAQLTRRFKGSAFRRSDLVAQFMTSAGVDVRPLLRTYVDSTGFIDSLTLGAKVAALDSLGAFGP